MRNCARCFCPWITNGIQKIKKQKRKKKPSDSKKFSRVMTCLTYFLVFSSLEVHQKSLWRPWQGLRVRVKIWRNPPVVKPGVLSVFIHSLIIYQPVMLRAADAFAMVSVTLSLKYLPFFVSVFPTYTSQKCTFYFRMLSCWNITWKMYLSFLWYHCISMVLSLFLLAPSCFLKFITYLDYVLNG